MTIDPTLNDDAHGGVEVMVQRLRAFVEEREWQRFHTVKNLSMLLASEAGELLARLRWTDGAASDAEARGPLREHVVAELGDIGIAWLLLCDRVGVDPLECVGAKIAVNEVNYPAALSRERAERPPTSGGHT